MITGSGNRIVTIKQNPSRPVSMLVHRLQDMMDLIQIIMQFPASEYGFPTTG